MAPNLRLRAMRINEVQAMTRGFVSGFLLTLTLGATAVATEPPAQAFMKDKQAELVLPDKKGGAESQQKIAAVFDSLLDYDALAQASLRDHWSERTESERREFSETLKGLVQRAYRKNLDRTLDYDVTFDGQTADGEAFTVSTTARSRTNAREEPVSINYVLHRVNGVFRIEDIVTEGSSLVGNYHQQFNRIIKKDGFAELMRRMKNKLSKES